MYRTSAVPTVNLETLKQIAQEENLEFTTEELEQCKKRIEGVSEYMHRLDDTPDVTLPVKYARTPGSIFRPPKNENKLNAWYYKCDIKGAPGGKLEGKTVAIKDNIQVAHVPLSNGTPIFRGFVPQDDATVVTRVLDAGGHIIGTTNVEDCCASANSCTGMNGPVLHPRDHTRTCGGSSCGSAVVVATGEADMALGCDQGGSIRIPSSWCGIVGLKPTHGLVPYTGIISLEPIADHCGPMARSVQDCALLLEALAGYDNGLDPRQHRDLEVPEYSKLLSLELARGKKVAFLHEGFQKCQEEVTTIIRECKHVFEAAGIDVLDDISVPMHSRRLGHLIGQYGFAANMSQMGVGFGHAGYKNVAMVDFLSTSRKTRLNQCSDHVRASVLVGKYLQTIGAERYYAKAVSLLPLLRQAYDDALSKADVLIMPTAPYVAPKLPTEKPSISENGSLLLGMTVNTSPFNLSGHPALTVNAGFNQDNLPVGIMIVGKHFDETTVLQIGYAFEHYRDQLKKK